MPIGTIDLGTNIKGWILGSVLISCLITGRETKEQCTLHELGNKMFLTLLKICAFFLSDKVMFLKKKINMFILAHIEASFQYLPSPSTRSDPILQPVSLHLNPDLCRCQPHEAL